MRFINGETKIYQSFRTEVIKTLLLQNDQSEFGIAEKNSFSG